LERFPKSDKSFDRKVVAWRCVSELGCWGLELELEEFALADLTGFDGTHHAAI
jgi:hypothetical protein